MRTMQRIAVLAAFCLAVVAPALPAATDETSSVAVSTSVPGPDTRTNREKFSDPDPIVRQNAVIYVGMEKKKTNVPALVKMLGDENAGVRRAAVNALVQTGDKSCVSALVDRYGAEKDLAVKMNIVVALGDLKARSALPLLTSLLKDSYPPFRSEALRALGKINDPGTYSKIVARLSDEAEGVQVMAAEVAGNLKLASAVPDLIKNLENSVPVVRRASVKALGKVADAAALPRLEQMLQDADSLVARTAKEAIGLISERGKETGAKPVKTTAQ